MTDYAKWDSHFMAVAAATATLSKDPSTKVGAVIANPSRRIIAGGFNGFPRLIEDTKVRYSNKTTKHALIVHAEANAILSAVSRDAGSTLYSTMAPCSECCKLIIQCGFIDKIICPDWRDDHGRYSKDAGVAQLLLNEGCIIHKTPQGKMHAEREWP